MKRTVQPELLDNLPPADPHAVRSRRDLRRVNTWMRHHSVMALALQQCLEGRVPGQITELGAGDGNFLLRVAKEIPVQPAPGGFAAHGPKAVLLDAQKIVSPETIKAFVALGWRAETVVSDVFDWSHADNEVVIANLFLHHFKRDRLTELFQMISQRTRIFIALEPRRSEWSLLCSRFLWAIGCNGVTRHDAVVSVRAGFSGCELSALWPHQDNWHLSEQPVGAFSQLFIARKHDVRKPAPNHPMAEMLSALR